MIATLPEMRALSHDLTVSLWTFTAIGVLFESGLAEHLREPRSLGELAAQSRPSRRVTSSGVSPSPRPQV